MTCGGRRWLAVLKMIELHVYVALADDELCDNIVIVSDCFFMYISVCVRAHVCVCVCVFVCTLPWLMMSCVIILLL